MRPLARCLAAVVAIGLCAVGCSKSAPKPPVEEKPAAPPPTTGYTAGPVTGGGAIRGTVSLTGAKPALPPVRCARDPEICGKSKPNQSLLLGPNDGVKNVILWLTDIHAGKAATPGQSRLDIKACAYQPRVQAVLAKSNVMVNNQDLVPHDLNGSIGPRSLFNRTILGKSEIVDLYTPGMVTLGCDMHDAADGPTAGCENGAIGVMPNPYFAVTGDDGSFTISEIPPGNYTLQTWHERLGEQSQRVIVAPSATVVADFHLAAK